MASSSAVLGLRRDHGCMRGLSWRVELPSTACLGAMREGLVARGFTDRDPGPGVTTFDVDPGHVLVMIPRTRRVQIRVCYIVPEPERAEVAEGLARLLAQVVMEAP